MRVPAADQIDFVQKDNSLGCNCLVQPDRNPAYTIIAHLKGGNMNQQYNSGKYVNYVDARSSSGSTGLVFSSANGDALSSIIRNQSFYSGNVVYTDTIELPKTIDSDKSDKG